ncbi:hypothetical protein Droror1_Dr00011110 [Drosera rotundifolia]
MSSAYRVRANPIDVETHDDNDDNTINVTIFYCDDVGLTRILPSFEIDKEDFLTDDNIHERVWDSVMPYLDTIPISCHPAAIDAILGCGIELVGNDGRDGESSGFGMGIMVYIKPEDGTDDWPDYPDDMDDDDDDGYDLDDYDSDVDYMDYLDDVEMGVRVAKKEVVEGLEKVVMMEKMEGTCAMCLEEFEEGSSTTRCLTRLPCSHVYHGECIGKWLEKSCCCPLCRYELPS